MTSAVCRSSRELHPETTTTVKMVVVVRREVVMDCCEMRKLSLRKACTYAAARRLATALHTGLPDHENGSRRRPSPAWVALGLAKRMIMRGIMT